MAQQIINVGAVDGDGKMDKLRVAFDKFNQNFTELYARFVVNPDAGVAHAAGVAVVSGVSSTIGVFNGVAAAAGVGSAAGIGSFTGGFNPTSLFASGETGGWWDPSDMSSMFQDTAGAIPVNATNQQVARINDKSGNGNHLLQATAGDRPFLQSAGGNRYLAFDGVSESIGLDFTQAQPITRASAVRIVAFIANSRMWSGLTSDLGAILFQRSASPQVGMYSGGTTVGDSTNFTIGLDHVVIEYWNDPGTSTLQIDNNTASTGSPGPGNPNGFSVAKAGSGEANSNIRWYGGISIGRLLTTGETNSCRTFFGAKAGLSL